MRESYVHPVTGAREPKREWVAVWRFRLVGFVLLALAAVATAWFVNRILYAAEQDPTPTPERSLPASVTTHR